MMRMYDSLISELMPEAGYLPTVYYIIMNGDVNSIFVVQNEQKNVIRILFNRTNVTRTGKKI
jgi:hypothetical protein